MVSTLEEYLKYRHHKSIVAKKLQKIYQKSVYESLKTRYNAFSKTQNDVFSGKILQCKMLILQEFWQVE